MKTDDERKAMLKKKAVDIYKQQINLGHGYKKAKEEAVAIVEQKRKEFDDNFEADPEDDPLVSETKWTIRMNQFDELVKMIKAL